MIDTIQRCVDDELSGFGGQERGVVLSLLAWLGLRYYAKVYAEEDLHLDLLQRLVGKYVNETKAKDLHNCGPRPVRSNSARHNRPDSMAHFPFTDQCGTMSEVLRGGYSEKPRILEMGVPGRKRYVERVFEEMRFDRGGIRLSDLPEAFDRIGIAISPTLRRMLEKTRAVATDGALGAEDSDQDNDFFRFHYMEKFITLAQWRAIVQRFLRLIRAGRDPSKLADILPPISHDDAYDGEAGRTFDEDDDCSEDLSEEAPHGAAGRPQTTAPGQITTTRPGSSGRRRQKLDLNLPCKARAYQRQLSQVSSKIAPVIRHDKISHRHNVHTTTAAAKQTIAKKRVDEFISNVPWGLYDPMASRAPKTRIPKNLEVMSGRSALDIAEAFLRGPVGREILERDQYRIGYQEDDLSPWQAQIQASHLLGLASDREAHSGGHHDGRHGGNHDAHTSSSKPAMHQPSAPSPTASSVAEGFVSAEQREKGRQREVEARALYSSDWTSSRGGWVADFGPAHTRAGYTGPERYRTSLDDLKRQQRNRGLSPARSAQRGVDAGGREHDFNLGALDTQGLLQDEMLFSVARDVLSTRADDPSVNEAKASPTTRSIANEMLGRSGASSGRFAAYPSDMSVDTAAAGAGSGADDFAHDDEFLATLQNSVALKDLVRK